MRKFAFVVPILLAVALPAYAQQSALKPGPGRDRVRLEISPAGQEIVKKTMNGQDPRLMAMAKQLQDVAKQVDVLSHAPKLDMVKLEAAVHRQEQLEQGLRVGSNARMLTMLKTLSETDRTVFMRSMADARRAAMQAQAPRQ